MFQIVKNHDVKQPFGYIHPYTAIIKLREPVPIGLTCFNYGIQYVKMKEINNVPHLEEFKIISISVDVGTEPLNFSRLEGPEYKKFLVSMKDEMLKNINIINNKINSIEGE